MQISVAPRLAAILSRLPVSSGTNCVVDLGELHVEDRIGVVFSVDGAGSGLPVRNERNMLQRRLLLKRTEDSNERSIAECR